jgi:hypothetical protein
VIRGTQYRRKGERVNYPINARGGTGKFGIRNARSDYVTRLGLGEKWYR